MENKMSDKKLYIVTIKRWYQIPILATSKDEAEYEAEDIDVYDFHKESTIISKEIKTAQQLPKQFAKQLCYGVEDDVYCSEWLEQKDKEKKEKELDLIAEAKQTKLVL
jgi:tRNA G10  N-methylase Trm11